MQRKCLYMCVCAWGAERQIRKYQSSHTSSRLFFFSHAKVIFSPNTQKEVSSEDFGFQLTPLLTDIFFIGLKCWSVTYSNSYDNVAISKSPSINAQTHHTSTEIC